MEFTRYRGNLDDADHPHSDPFSDGGFYGADSEFDRDLLFFANAYQAATSFQQQQDGADVEQDDELDLGSEDEDFGAQGSESEEDAGPIPDDAFWRAPSVESSLAELSSPQPSDYSDPDPDPDLGSDSDSDSDSPASDQSRSSSESASESASPGNDSTASDDSLFVVQDHALLAHLFYSEQLYRHPERLPQSMADFHQHDLEAPRPSRLANLLAGPHRAPQRVDSPEDDELFEMEVGSLPRGRGSRGQAPEPVRVPARASVIDLTNEPDSPEEIAASSFLRNSAQAAPANLPSSRRNRANPRRQQLLGRTPSLSRSDGSILGAAPVIDLTLDDDDMEPMAPPGLFGNPRRPVLPPIRRRAPGDARRPIDLVVENPDEGARGYLTARLNRSPGNALSSISSFFRASWVTPPHSTRWPLCAPAPCTLLHITRWATICPTSTTEATATTTKESPSPPSFRRRRLARALAATRLRMSFLSAPAATKSSSTIPMPSGPRPGRPKRRATGRTGKSTISGLSRSVDTSFCKKCFDDRRKKHSGSAKTTFRTSDQKTFLCGVDDCNSDVGPKANWVGVFL